MPVSPETGAKHAGPAADLVTSYELDLLTSAVQTLRGDQGREEWAARALREIAQWRAEVNRGVPGATARLMAAVSAALAAARDEGASSALADLPDAPSVLPLGTRGVRLNSERLTTTLAGALQQAPAALEQVLRQAVSASAADVQGGGVSRRQASQRVLDRLVASGITGFRDSAGRNWSLSSYTEMAVRTRAAEIAVDTHVASLRELGVTEVVVSDSPRECSICRPYEGKVLRITSTGPGTLAGARAAGFQHPNCTHSVSAHIAGSTRPVKAKADPEGYEQKQRQRALERRVREWKRREAVALDPAARTRARAGVLTSQATLRDYVKQNELKRQPARESITRAV